MFCQLVYLRRCIPGRIRRALNELPETLDETYARSLEEIDEQNWEYAHRLFQCVAAASRPLFVNELAEFLAFDFEAESTPVLLAGWRPEDPAHSVLSICSSLLSVVKPDGGSPVVQFAHFSVKEYLTSARLIKAKDTISRFYVSMTAAHAIVAQACLGVLLHLDENVTEGSLEKLPLANYASEHWAGHARVENVSLKVQDGMKRLFDPSKCHLSVWVWIYDPENPSHRRWRRSERPERTRAIPLHYAASCGIHDVVKFLIVEHSQDVNAQGMDKETALHLASLRGHVDVAKLLLKHGADIEAQDDDERTPLHLASRVGHVEIARVLLEHGADTEARDYTRRTPLSLVSEYGRVEVARVLFKHGADLKVRDYRGYTPLFRALLTEQVEVARLLLDYGADMNARDCNGLTPLELELSRGHAEVARMLLEHTDPNDADTEGRTQLHLTSEYGSVEAARVLLEHGLDANARDINNATPLHLASSYSPNHARGKIPDVVRLLLQYGSDVHARDSKGRTPFMRAAEHGHHEVMELLLQNGAEDHRK